MKELLTEIDFQREKRMPEKMAPHIHTIRQVGRESVTWLLDQLKEVSDGLLRLTPNQQHLLAESIVDGERMFFGALTLSNVLAEQSLNGERVYPSRSIWENPKMQAMVNELGDVYSPASLVWQLDGIGLLRQRGGLKEIYGGSGCFNRHFPTIFHDVLGSATSLNIGANNPYPAAVEDIEQKLGIRDNECIAYHGSLSQLLAARFLSSLYPNEEPVCITTESSGTAVNSLAIEAVCAYGEEAYRTFKRWLDPTERQVLIQEVVQTDPFIAKRFNSENPTIEDLALLETLGYIKLPKVLQVKGTWCGGFGTAKEGTGFGVANQAELRGGPRWVDRCLPLPTAENKDTFLRIVSEKITNREAAGVLLEPIVGDAGIIPADQDLVEKLVQILKKGYNGKSLPIIVDAVQQSTGRTGNYWGVEHLPALKEYPLLVLTTAKSASNGQAFGFCLFPKPIIKAAYPLSQITTNSGNGAFLRASLVAKFITDPRIQQIIDKNAQVIDEVANTYDLEVRGLRMNRGIYTGSKDLMELIQWHLYLTYGILVGALPATVRFQPMLLEHPKTIKMITEAVCKGTREILDSGVTIEEKDGIKSIVDPRNKIPDYVKRSFLASADPSGLNR